MPNYRRRHIAGGTYFFTVVTENRRRLLCPDLARKILRETIVDCLRDNPFDLVAMVLLPDHPHYNPVKHAVAKCPHDYPYSTFRKWVTRSAFEPSWYCGCDGRIAESPCFEGLDDTAME